MIIISIYKKYFVRYWHIRLYPLFLGHTVYVFLVNVSQTHMEHFIKICTFFPFKTKLVTSPKQSVTDVLSIWAHPFPFHCLQANMVRVLESQRLCPAVDSSHLHGYSTTSIAKYHITFLPINEDLPQVLPVMY